MNMQKIVEPNALKELEGGNRFIGELPTMINSSVTFSGNNNIFFCEKNVRLVNSTIKFHADNSIVFLCENRHEYKLSVSVYHNSAFYMGKNNYINGTLNAILSEQKHVFIGNDCLFSSGIWIRNADPHLIYDAESKKRINPTKSIFIGDHVWLGQSVMILKGTQIDSGSIIGAMSVVSGKRIPHNSSWAGNPARNIKENIFWHNPCVHKWTDEKTAENEIFNDDAYIYKHDAGEHIPFAKIDKALTFACGAEEKLVCLQKITADINKNRFVSDCSSKKDKSGFFSKNKG